MKKLRIACFIFALVNLGFFIIVLIEPATYNPNAGIKYLGYLSIFARISSAVITVILARKLDRSLFGWLVFSFLIPWLAGFIITFLDENIYGSYKNYSYNGNEYGYNDSISHTSTYLADKSCSACGRSVSLSSSAGQKCPYCGAYWSSERQITR